MNCAVAIRNSSGGHVVVFVCGGGAGRSTLTRLGLLAGRGKRVQQGTVQPDARSNTAPDVAAPAVPLRDWRYAAEMAVYQRSVEVLLSEPSVTGRLLSRPEVTADAVRTAMQAPAAVNRAFSLSRKTLLTTREKLDERTKTRRKAARARAEAGLEPASLAVLLYLGALIVAAPERYSYWSQTRSVLVEAAVGAALGGWLMFRPRARRHLWSLFVRVVSPFEQWLDKEEAEIALKALEAEFTAHSARQVLLEVITALLGDDPHSVLMYDSYQGLRARDDAQFFVLSACGRQLARKLSLIDGGTIALSGPRGSGKTTLLRAAPDLLRTDTPADRGGADLVVAVDVPAAYTPYDFLLSCLVGVCEQYLRRSGQAVPDLTRLSGMVKRRRQLAGLVRRGVRWSLFAVPAAALFVLGAAAAVRGWWDGHRSLLQSWTAEGVQEAVHGVTVVWQGKYTIICLAILYASAIVWTLRAPGRLRRFLGVGPRDRIGWVIVWIVGWCLFLAPVVDVLLDFGDFLRDSPLRLLDELIPFSADAVRPLVLATLALIIVFVGLLVPQRPRSLTRQDRLLLAVTSAVAAGAGVLSAFSTSRAYLSDPENPARLGLLMLGMGLVAASRSRRKPRPTQTPLAQRCEDQLYRLRTAQSTSASLNLAPTALFTTAHSSSLSSVPPNFPQLVAEFRELLGAITEELRATDNGHVFLCIDELDRMGTADKAREFLGEVKAVLGIPWVFCLVTVAEDVSAAFVRRGLPNRDATDSSFDDVVHVRPMALSESVAILQQRVRRLPYPYAVLAHALSGGIPRDLIRYALRLVELRESTPYVELRDISHLMLTEELSDTLAGFRTLLAAQPWTASTAHVLTGYRVLTEQLDASCPHRREALVRALQAFVWPTAPAPGAQDSAADTEGHLPEATRLLIAEARAYAVYGLTLLQVFAPSSFDQRSAEVAAQAPDGATQRLADMRLELAVSPYSARELIHRVRRAWDLPDTTAPVPPAESGTCTHLPCIPAPRTGAGFITGNSPA
jgi:energy-coupling factor transporter ATP-binding protein EcfA2